MESKTTLKNIASTFIYYTALITTANGLGAFDSWHSPNCWAQQTVTVSPGDNLQALVNQYPSSTTFSFSPGIYRLQSIVPQSYDSFVGQSGAILSGAALLTSFTQNGSYWTAQVSVTQAASYPGQCKSTSPACIYPEDLFFNNVPKNRVASLAAVGPGYWYLDYSTGTVYMGDSPWGSTVELSELPYAFTGSATNVTISNLTIEKYASVAQSGAIDGGSGSAYWAIEGNHIRYNHGRGITDGNGMYIDSNNIYSNGQMGIGGSGTNITVTSNHISYNNYAGFSYYWEAGGAKFSNVQNATVQYNYSYNNAGPGFWNDGNSQYITYNENQASGNVKAGILSVDSSNIIISNNYIWNDGFNVDGSGIWWGAGILLNDSSTVSVSSNNVSNCMNGIGGLLSNQGNAPNGQPYLLQNLTVSGNTITQGTGIAAGIVAQGTGFDNSVYTSWNNTFQSNTFNLANPLGIYFDWLGEPLTLAAWQGVLSGVGSIGGAGSSTSVTTTTSASSLAFGNQPVETSSSPQAVTVSNTGGAAESIGVSGANPADFTENNACGSSVAAGGSCTVTVSFTPSAIGSRGASLILTDNSGNISQSIALSGTGTHDVIITWTGNGAAISGYNVYRGTTSGGETVAPLNSSPVTGATFADANVQAGQTYYYVVTAVGSNGSSQSAGSNEAAATVPSP